MKSVAKAYCLLTDLKPKRRGLPDGSVDIDYYSVFQSLVKSNKLASLMSQFPLLSIKSEILQNCNLFLQTFLQETPLEQLRSVNKGMFQLLLWVKATLVLNKLLNPLNFVSTHYVKRRCTSEEVEHAESIYQALENWRFTFNLKVKSTKQTHAVGIINKAKDIIEEMEATQGTSIMRPQSEHSVSLGAMFFETFSEVPTGARPAFFEKVLVNFFKSYDEFEEEVCNIGDPFGL